jgi:hypothetical protein
VRAGSDGGRVEQSRFGLAHHYLGFAAQRRRDRGYERSVARQGSARARQRPVRVGRHPQRARAYRQRRLSQRGPAHVAAVTLDHRDRLVVRARHYPQASVRDLLAQRIGPDHEDRGARLEPLTQQHGRGARGG